MLTEKQANAIVEASQQRLWWGCTQLVVMAVLNYLHAEITGTVECGWYVHFDLGSCDCLHGHRVNYLKLTVVTGGLRN